MRRKKEEGGRRRKGQSPNGDRQMKKDEKRPAAVYAQICTNKY
jgi:hypothetical protein